MPAAWRVLTSCLNSCTCSPRSPRRGVLVVRRQIADRVVAPVVAEPEVREPPVVDELVDGQQLDRGHAEPFQVRRGRPGRQGRRSVPRSSGVIAGVGGGQALDVSLVDHRLVPGRAERAVVPQSKKGLMTIERGTKGALSASCGRLGVVADGGRRPPGPSRPPLDRLGVGIEEELRRVAALPRARSPRPVDPEAVALTGPDPGDVAVPAEGGHLGESTRCSAPPSGRRRRGRARPARPARKKERSSFPSRPRSRPGGTAHPARSSPPPPGPRGTLAQTAPEFSRRKEQVAGAGSMSPQAAGFLQFAGRRDQTLYVPTEPTWPSQSRSCCRRR